MMRAIELLRFSLAARGAFFAVAAVVALFCGCRPPVEVDVALWTPAVETEFLLTTAGIDLFVDPQNIDKTARIPRTERAVLVDDLTVPEDGLTLDTLLMHAIDLDANVLAVGRTGEATLFPDGVTSPSALFALMFPPGVHLLHETQPGPRAQAAICAGGFGRAFVFGGHAPEDTVPLAGGVRLDPSVRDVVDVDGPTARNGSACATIAATDEDAFDTLWLAGGCDATQTAFGLERSDDHGETFTTVDTTPLSCTTSMSILDDNLWILTGDTVQLRSATDGTLIADRTITPARVGGQIIATSDGAVVGGGTLTDGVTPADTSLDYLVESGGALTTTAFGPARVRDVSFTRSANGTVFALVFDGASHRIHRLRPDLGSAPVEIETTQLNTGGFVPGQIVSAPNDAFFVLDATQSTAREYSDSGLDAEFTVRGAAGATAIAQTGGAVLLMGGADAGVHASVRQGTGD